MLLPAVSLGAVLTACDRGPASTPPDAGATGSSVTLTFVPDAPLGDEAYVCFGFEVSAAVRAAGLKAIAWEPAAGAVTLHHGTLYFVNAGYPSEPVPCDQQPTGAIPLHVWAPGSEPLLLPGDVALAVPDDAVSLVVEAHVYRFAAGQPAIDRVQLTLASGDAHLRAGWSGRNAPVPPLRPGYLETSTDSCTLTAGMHVYFAWPHEHLLGRSFHAGITGPAGAFTLVDVPTWNFTQQVAVAVDADVAAGDVLDMACSWLNSTDRYVLPGPRTTDEMCGLGLIVSPPPPGGALPCRPAR